LASCSSACPGSPIPRRPPWRGCLFPDWCDFHGWHRRPTPCRTRCRPQGRGGCTTKSSVGSFKSTMVQAGHTNRSLDPGGGGRLGELGDQKTSTAVSELTSRHFVRNLRRRFVAEKNVKLRPQKNLFFSTEKRKRDR
jgi:hypothetical protein